MSKHPILFGFAASCIAIALISGGAAADGFARDAANKRQPIQSIQRDVTLSGTNFYHVMQCDDGAVVVDSRVMTRDQAHTLLATLKCKDAVYVEEAADSEQRVAHLMLVAKTIAGERHDPFATDPE